MNTHKAYIGNSFRARVEETDKGSLFVRLYLADGLAQENDQPDFEFIVASNFREHAISVFDFIARRARYS
jgi:hypothetical protein